MYYLSCRKTIQYNDIMTSMSLFVKRVENFGDNINLGELDNESVIHLKL
jgi:phosphosulfolactate synthase (CoM biosynthesis protein A)